MTITFEQVAQTKGATGGVTVHNGHVLFAAVDEGVVYDYDPKAATDADTNAVTIFRKYTNRTNGLASGPDGVVFGGQASSRRVVAFNPDGTSTVPAEKLDGRWHNYPAEVTSDGTRVYFADPYSTIPSTGAQVHGKLEHASVLLLARTARRDWKLTRATYDTAHPYGVALSADSSVLFVSETDPLPGGVREVRAYPVAKDGSLGNYRLVHRFGSDASGSHRGAYGMGLLDEDILVCAGDSTNGAGPLVYRFTAGGRLLCTYPAPDSPVSVAALDGALYVTTSGGGLYRGLLDT